MAPASASWPRLGGPSILNGNARGAARILLSVLAGCNGPEDEPERRSELFRGEVALAGTQWSIRLCDSDADLPFMDRTNGVLQSAYQNLAGAPGERVFVEGLGRRDSSLAEAGAEGTATATIVKLRRASPLGESSACESPPSAAVVTAGGNEPFWSVTVFHDRIVFTEPENLTGIEFPPTGPVEEGSKRVYRSTRAGSQPSHIELALSDGGCTDSMSGAYLHMTAMVRLDDRALEGCAAES